MDTAQIPVQFSSKDDPADGHADAGDDEQPQDGEKEPQACAQAGADVRLPVIEIGGGDVNHGRLQRQESERGDQAIDAGGHVEDEMEETVLAHGQVQEGRPELGQAVEDGGQADQQDEVAPHDVIGAANHAAEVEMLGQGRRAHQRLQAGCPRPRVANSHTLPCNAR